MRLTEFIRLHEAHNTTSPGAARPDDHDQQDHTYWAGHGKHQKEQNRLWKKLVPSEGKCKTLEGEMLRAQGKIYYDYYNNGFGNTWSAAYNFLKHHAKKFGIDTTSWSIVAPYARGRHVKGGFGGDKRLEVVLEKMADDVLEVAMKADNNKESYTPNDQDMWDFKR